MGQMDGRTDRQTDGWEYARYNYKKMHEKKQKLGQKYFSKTNDDAQYNRGAIPPLDLVVNTILNPIIIWHSRRIAKVVMCRWTATNPNMMNVARQHNNREQHHFSPIKYGWFTTTEREGEMTATWRWCGWCCRRLLGNDNERVSRKINKPNWMNGYNNPKR